MNKREITQTGSGNKHGLIYAACVVICHLSAFSTHSLKKIRWGGVCISQGKFAANTVKDHPLQFVRDGRGASL